MLCNMSNSVVSSHIIHEYYIGTEKNGSKKGYHTLTNLFKKATVNLIGGHRCCTVQSIGDGVRDWC